MSKSYPERRSDEIKKRNELHGTREQNQGNFLQKPTTSQQQKKVDENRKRKRYTEKVVRIPKPAGLVYVRVSDCRRDWQQYAPVFNLPNTRAACNTFIRQRQIDPIRIEGPCAPQRSAAWYLGNGGTIIEE